MERCRDRTPERLQDKQLNKLQVMKKVIYVVGIALFIIGLILSSAQREDGSPAPIVNLGAAVAMCIGGKIISDEIKKEEGESNG